MNQNIFRNLIVVFLLLILATTTLVIKHSNNSKNDDNKKDKEISDITPINGTVIVFLESDIAIEKIENVKKEIMDIISQDDEILFKSKDQVRQEMVEESEIMSEVLKDFDTREKNPLHDVFYLNIKDSNNIEELIDCIEKIDGVEKVIYHEKKN